MFRIFYSSLICAAVCITVDEGHRHDLKNFVLIKINIYNNTNNKPQNLRARQVVNDLSGFIYIIIKFVYFQIVTYYNVPKRQCTGRTLHKCPYKRVS